MSNSSNPKVYVINRGGHDFSPAEAFGEVRFLSDGPVSQYETSKIYRAMKSALENSHPDDYILLSGLTVMAAIACSIFSVKHKRLNLLIYRPQDHSYLERRISLESVSPEDEAVLLSVMTCNQK